MYYSVSILLHVLVRWWFCLSCVGLCQREHEAMESSLGPAVVQSAGVPIPDGSGSPQRKPPRDQSGAHLQVRLAVMSMRFSRELSESWFCRGWRVLLMPLFWCLGGSAWALSPFCPLLLSYVICSTIYVSNKEGEKYCFCWVSLHFSPFQEKRKKGLPPILWPSTQDMNLSVHALSPVYLSTCSFYLFCFITDHFCTSF